MSVANDTQCVGIHRVCTRGGKKGRRGRERERGKREIEREREEREGERERERERERESEYGKQALQGSGNSPI